MSSRRFGNEQTAMSETRQRRDLTLDEVVDRAMAIAQSEGESAVTMRGVAEACGVTPMALYHHVDNKEALLTALVDRVVADAIDTTESDDNSSWRDDLIEFCSRYRAGFLAHPTAARVYLRRPVISPARARCTELMFEAFERGGLTGDQLAEATDATVLLLMGSIANDLTRPDEVRYQLADELDEREGARLRSAIDAYSSRDGEVSFRRSLNWLLDGLLAELA